MRFQPKKGKSHALTTILVIQAESLAPEKSFAGCAARKQPRQRPKHFT